MMMNKIIIKTLTLSMCAMLWNCSPTVNGKLPKDFAAYKKKSIYKAVSSDGILFRVKIEENDPPAKLSFWKEAIQKRMENAGYKVSDTSSVKIGGIPGSLLELTTPFGPKDYNYLIAIAVKEDEILVVESSGEITDFQKRKIEILTAIKGIEF